MRNSMRNIVLLGSLFGASLVCGQVPHAAQPKLPHYEYHLYTVIEGELPTLEMSINKLGKEGWQFKTIEHSTIMNKEIWIFERVSN